MRSLTRRSGASFSSVVIFTFGLCAVGMAITTASTPAGAATRTVVSNSSASVVNPNSYTSDPPYQPVSFGNAPSYSTQNVTYDHPVVGMASTPDGKGYWLVASDGGVFTFGDAQFYGSAGSLNLVKPIVGIAATPDGKGYWLVASDGGVFSFGDANFYGSTGATHLNQPVVGMTATPDGKGYSLVASDGGVFAFGDAGFYGSTGAIHLNQPIVGMAATPDGHGYWLVASDGGVFTFGDAQFDGSLAGGPPITNPVVAISATPGGGGYWLLPTLPTAPAGVPSLGQPAGAYLDNSLGLGHVEPPQVFLGGDANGDLSQISWSSWGGTSATGTGQAEYVAPGQTDSQGTVETATVVAFNRGTCDGSYMYQALEWYFPQDGQSFNPTTYLNVCTGN
jgi:ribosomal protein L24E